MANVLSYHHDARLFYSGQYDTRRKIVNARCIVNSPAKKEERYD